MKHLLLLLLFLTGIASKAQVPASKMENLLHLKPSFTGKLDLTSLKENQIFLSMDFDSAVIKNPQTAQILKGKSVTKIELYYTAFQVSQSFSQPRLNKERFENLYKICPEVFRQSFIEWKVTGQNACKNEKTARTFFHGFVITYIPEPTKTSIGSELSSITKFLNSDSLGHDSVFYTSNEIVKKKRKRTGFYLPKSKKKLEEGIVYSSKGIWNRKPQYEIHIDTIERKYEHKIFVPSSSSSKFVQQLPDTTIFTVLKRYKNWKNILFVCDVTGSMAPYTTQVLVWHKLNYNTGKARHFTFFNDGDNTPDNKKKIGRTGGIYNVAADSYADVSKVMSNAMINGGGGDAPENNCEALINAINNVPDAQEIVMIADNWANIKDLKLAVKINKPVHIILCGATEYINTDYLELARMTGGSIHTIENDLENLAKLNEGQKISFGSQQFIIRRGKFEPYNSI